MPTWFINDPLTEKTLGESVGISDGEIFIRFKSGGKQEVSGTPSFFLKRYLNKAHNNTTYFNIFSFQI